MQWFSKIGNLLDEMDTGQDQHLQPQPQSQSQSPTASQTALQAEESEEVETAEQQTNLASRGTSLMGRGLGFLSNAAVAASSALDAANNAVEKAGSAVDSLGVGATSRLSTVLAELNESSDTNAQTQAETFSTDTSAEHKEGLQTLVAVSTDELKQDSEAPSDVDVSKHEMPWLDKPAVVVSETGDLLSETSSSITDAPAREARLSDVALQQLQVSESRSVGVDQVVASSEVDAMTSSMGDSVLEQWHIEDPSTSNVSLPLSSDAPRSPTPSLDADSITTSGAGTDTCARVAEILTLAPNMESLALERNVEVQDDAVEDLHPKTPPETAESSFVALSPVGGGGDGSSGGNGSSTLPTTPSETLLGESQDAELSTAEAQLDAANQQILRLQVEAQQAAQEAQGRLKELSISQVEAQQAAQEAQDRLKELSIAQAEAQQAAQEAEGRSQELRTRLTASEEMRQSLTKEVEEMRKKAESAESRAHTQARASADKEKELVVDELREEMEKELQKMLRMKDDQVKALERKVSEADRLRREQQREMDKRDAELEAVKEQFEELKRTGEGQAGHYRRELDDLSSEHQRRLTDLEHMKEEEERLKREMALSLRGVEERARADIIQLEGQRAQLELHTGALQAQLDAEKQKCAELALSLGDVTQSASVDFAAEEANAAAEELRDLRDRLRASEERVADARSAKDALAEEMEKLRSELKAVHVERSRLDAELRSAQEAVRELQAATSLKESRESPDASQKSMAEAMQKDFDDRLERHKDEVGYLRQKCDEKERRCEHLLAERSTLASEVKALKEANDRWSTAAEVEAGKQGHPTSVVAGRAPTRGLPLSSPVWLRSFDEPLRMVVRVVANSPPARIIFFSYVILLHVWVLFILQNAAMQGAVNDSSIAPPRPSSLTASSSASAGSPASAFLGSQKSTS